jgi:hypothetical protein
MLSIIAWIALDRDRHATITRARGCFELHRSVYQQSTSPHGEVVAVSSQRPISAPILSRLCACRVQ